MIIGESHLRPEDILMLLRKIGGGGGSGKVVIVNGVICIDDGEGNITIIDAERTINLDGAITVTDDGSGNVYVAED